MAGVVFRVDLQGQTGRWLTVAKERRKLRSFQFEYGILQHCNIHDKTKRKKEWMSGYDAC